MTASVRSFGVSAGACRWQVSGLHSHAAQRLVGLTSSMARRWLKLTQAAEVALQPPSTDVQVGWGRSVQRGCNWMGFSACRAAPWQPFPPAHSVIALSAHLLDGRAACKGDGREAHVSGQGRSAFSGSRSHLQFVLCAIAAAAASDPHPSAVCQVLGDFLRILLEVINCILSLNLGRNPELVYALLHKQEVVEQLRPHPGFSELVDNLKVGHRACLCQASRDATMPLHMLAHLNGALRCCMVAQAHAGTKCSPCVACDLCHMLRVAAATSLSSATYGVLLLCGAGGD